MRYPIIHQPDVTDCGPAALAMIATHYGRPISIPRLRELARTGRHGTNLSGLSAAAEQVGFQARAVRAIPSALNEVPLPAIAHWRESDRNHFVVLYKITAKRALIGDPASGLRKLSRETFLKTWTGVLLLLTPTARFRNQITGKFWLMKLFSFLLPHHRLFLDALVAAVPLTILGLTSSLFIQALVDFVFVLGRKPALNWLGLGMLLVTLARAGFLGLRSYLLAHLSRRIDAETVLGYHRHLLGLPLTFFYSRRIGEILSRTNGAIKIRAAVSVTTLSIALDAFLVVITAGIMIWLNWELALRSLQLIPALACVVWILNRRLKRHQGRAVEKDAELEAQIAESAGAIHEIKAFRAESTIQLRTEASCNQMLEAGLDSQLLNAHITTLSSLTAGLSTLGLLWFGGHQVLAGALTVGRFMAFHTMLGTILGPIERLANTNQSILDAVIAADRLGEVLDLDSEVSHQRANPLDVSLKGAIDFRDVTFRYGSGAPVFEHLNLRIQAGECVGIIGGSGCGKTTLVRLLTRFLEPMSGRVIIDGHDVQDFAFDCLRREIALVPQDIVLLSGSIADNIRFGRPTATAAEIREVARAVRIEDFVSRLPHGYDTLVGERGKSLSAGERQRVAIARAVLLNPSVLVLDEPTCHLDSESEFALQSVINQRHRNHCTTIVISHRPLPVGRLIHLREKGVGASAS